MLGLDHQTILLLLLTGFLGGLLSGAMGVGGGIVMVPMMVFLLGMTQHEAQGTYLGMMIPPLALFSAINYWKAGNINWKYALILMITFMLGSYFGSYIANNYLNDNTLRKIFAIIMLITALKMLF